MARPSPGRVFPRPGSVCEDVTLLCLRGSVATDRERPAFRPNRCPRRTQTCPVPAEPRSEPAGLFTKFLPLCLLPSVPLPGSRRRRILTQRFPHRKPPKQSKPKKMSADAPAASGTSWAARPRATAATTRRGAPCGTAACAGGRWRTWCPTPAPGCSSPCRTCWCCSSPAPPRPPACRCPCRPGPAWSWACSAGPPWTAGRASSPPD